MTVVQVVMLVRDLTIEKIREVIEIMIEKEMIMTEDLKIRTGQGIMNLITRKIMITGVKIMEQALKTMIIGQRITIINEKMIKEQETMITEEKV